MGIPVIGLFVYPNISPFHFSIPHIIFNIKIEDKPLFDLKVFSLDGDSVKTESAMTITPDGGVDLINDFDLVIIPGWDDFNHVPDQILMDGLNNAYKNGSRIVGLCYGTYALAYAGLLERKKAATHWMAEQDFSERFPQIQLDHDALYVEDQRIVTSAGTGAALDCCLYLVREIYNAQIANKFSRVMVIPPHREGGQAQFIEQPVAESGQDAKINLLLDFLRKNLAIQHNIEGLAQRTHMTRRTFTRHFKKATGMTLVDWLNTERIRLSSELLETTNLSIEKITELSGFNNTVSFRKKFREKYGTSPQAWRKAFGIINEDNLPHLI
ncbi:AraC family transcriptional regulator [Acinetobacter sp. TGL-Y2]|uniref:GlxA family transcriptional regulator n=1 Tax=Acinetobacter sp. TGL-Y2 TaxID=1407071 RepID=UPI0007A6596B|nr:helix-turn-helix domain-containing protein [Acinetobacter sp. TGL-Y2]AMW78389.1 AraC family transcriptional regulator [Acinetobacter sp. TGL-Y2]